MTSKFPKLHVIAAACRPSNGIGKNNDLPWKLPTDMKYFKDMTSSSSECKVAVIMGRRTWDSVPPKFRPFKNRVNVVLTSKKDFEAEGALKASSMEEAVKACQGTADKIWIIGGSSVYEDALNNYDCRVYLTEIDKEFECDTFFPSLDENRYKVTSVSKDHEENGITFRFKIFDCIDS